MILSCISNIKEECTAIIKPNTLTQGNSLRLLPQLADTSIDLILTDPPYGIQYRSRRGEAIAGDKRPFIWWLYDAYRVLKDTGCLLCFTRWDVLDAWKTAIQYAGFTVRSCIVWDKALHGMGNTKAAFAPRHEMILLADKGGFCFPGKRPVDLIQEKKVPSAHMIHPTEKPSALLMQLIEAVTRPGDLVLDPFAGSGSTLEACIRTGRAYIGMELMKEYIDRARIRIRRVKEEVHGSENTGP